jgi:hypothetical protein
MIHERESCAKTISDALRRVQTGSAKDNRSSADNSLNSCIGKRINKFCFLIEGNLGPRFRRSAAIRRDETSISCLLVYKL